MVDPSRDLARFVAVDLPCRRCGYNLRGLGVDGICPECGSRVSRAFGGDWIRLSDPAWLARVTLGAWLLTLAVACLVPAMCASVLLFRYNVNVSQWVNFLLVGISLCGACGGWLLTAPDPARARETPEIPWHWRTRVLLVAAATGSALHFLEKIALVPPDQYLVLVVLLGAAGIATILAPFALLRLMRDLARRIPDQILAARASNFLIFVLSAFCRPWPSAPCRFPSPFWDLDDSTTSCFNGRAMAA